VSTLAILFYETQTDLFFYVCFIHWLWHTFLFYFSGHHLLNMTIPQTHTVE